MSEATPVNRGWLARALSASQGVRDGWLFVFAIASLSSGATYSLTRMWGSYELDDYRQGKELKLSQTIGELKNLSAALAPSIADRRRLADLEPLPAENKELRRKLKAAQDQVMSLSAAVANSSEPVQIKELVMGGSFEPIPNGVMIALTDIQWYARKCRVNLGSRVEDIVAGGREGAFDSRSGTNFSIGVASVTENTCVLKYQREPSTKIASAAAD